MISSQEAYARKRAHICKLWPTFFSIKSGLICSQETFFWRSLKIWPREAPHPTLFPRHRSINCNSPYLCHFFVDLNKIRLNFRVLDTKESIGGSLKCKFIICYVISLPWLCFAGAINTVPHLFISSFKGIVSLPIPMALFINVLQLEFLCFWNWNLCLP